MAVASELRSGSRDSPSVHIAAVSLPWPLMLLLSTRNMDSIVCHGIVEQSRATGVQFHTVPQAVLVVVV